MIQPDRPSKCGFGNKFGALRGIGGGSSLEIPGINVARAIATLAQRDASG
jgi:hypothetical protein